jgi:putative aldouronate transport system permease protein
LAEQAIFKGAAVKKKKKGFLYEIKKNWTLFFMLMPGLLVILFNNVLPMFGMVIAFKDINYKLGILRSKWYGFNNFKYLFTSSQAWLITRTTLGYNIVFIIIGATLAVALAIGYNELLNRKAAKFYQTVMFLPYFLSWVVISYLVFSLLSTDMGLLNKITGKSIEWYSKTAYWPWIIIIVNTWKWTGYDSVIYLATLIGFDKSLYEAAAVDGASRWTQLTKITLPLLKPTIIILAIIKIGRVFFSDFGLFFNVPRNTGMLFDVTNTIDTYVYRALMQTGDIGMASAAGFYQSVVGLVVIITANFIVRKIDKESALF